MEVLHVNTQHAPCPNKPIIIRQQHKLPLSCLDNAKLQISKSNTETSKKLQVVRWRCKTLVIKVITIWVCKKRVCVCVCVTSSYPGQESGSRRDQAWTGLWSDPTSEVKWTCWERETHLNHKTDQVQTSELYGRDLLFYSANHLASNMLPAPVGQHLNHFSTTKTPLMSDSGLLEWPQPISRSISF